MDAGDPEDCGHKRQGGEFDLKNTCASGSAEWLKAKVASPNTEERIRTDRGFALRFMDAAAEHMDSVYGGLPRESQDRLRHLDQLAQDSAGRLSNFQDLVRNPKSEERIKNDLVFARDFQRRARDFSPSLGNSDRERAEHLAEIAEKTLSAPDRPRFAARIIGSIENYKHHTKKVFGKDVSSDEIVSMSGFEEFHSLYKNSNIEIDAGNDVLNDDHSSVQASFEANDRDGNTVVKMHRTFKRDDNNHLICENDSFVIYDENAAKKGIGLKVFSSQVDNLLKHGVSRIDTHAAGYYGVLNHPNPQSKLSGYFVWPKFGYDTNIYVTSFLSQHHSHLKNLVSKGGGKFTIDGRFQLSDLMATPEGQEFWMKHGSGRNMTFDLSQGSTSRRVLSLYRKGKGVDDPAGPDRYRLSEGVRASKLISRYLRAGQATDCGRTRNDGKFSPGNVCATGRHPGQIADEAAARADRWMETPVGQATIAASRKSPAPSSRTIPVDVARVVWAASRRQAHNDDVVARILFSQNLSIFKWIAASSSSKLGPAGEAIGGLPVGSLAYLAHAQSSDPTHKINKARAAVRVTMKRMHGLEKPPSQRPRGEEEKLDIPGKEKYSSSQSPRRFAATEEERSESKALAVAAKNVHKYGDYYFAILSVALEKSGGDLDLSVRIADHTFKGTTSAGTAQFNPSSQGRTKYSKTKAPQEVSCLAGRLQLSESGWGLLKVPNNLVRGLFDAIHEPGVSLPPKDSDSPKSKWKLNAHVSVLRPEEIKKIGGSKIVTEWGHHFHYQIGPVKKVKPAGWDAMDEVYFVDIDSPELEEMREKYGLSRLPNKGKYRFHVSIAVKPKGKAKGASK